MTQHKVTDTQSTLAEIRNTVRKFVDERDWQQYHSPKNLCMAMSIEVAELMEHFQWISPAESREIHGREDRRELIVNELADVFCYVLALANEMDVDLAAALDRKMELNREKYPVEKFRGKFE